METLTALALKAQKGDHEAMVHFTNSFTFITKRI